MRREAGVSNEMRRQPCTIVLTHAERADVAKELIQDRFILDDVLRSRRITQ